MKFSRWEPEDIVVPDRLRKGIRENIVITLMDSIRQIGLREPPTIRIELDEDGGEYPILVAGQHRVEACKRLDIERIDCVVFDGDEIDARLWEIAENLHRAELTPDERDEHIREWGRLTEEDKMRAGAHFKSWLRVSGTTERPEIDQCERHQLHAVMPLLFEFKAQQHPLEFVLLREGALHA